MAKRRKAGGRYTPPLTRCLLCGHAIASGERSQPMRIGSSGDYVIGEGHIDCVEAAAVEITSAGGSVSRDAITPEFIASLTDDDA